MRQLRYVEHLAIQQAYDISRREYLPPFGAMYGLAVSVHLIALAVWSLMPGTTPLTVPLQALHVRLGGAEGMEGGDAPKMPMSKNKPIPPKQEAVTPPRPKQVNASRVVTGASRPKAPAQPKRDGPPPTVSPSARGVNGLSSSAGQGVNYGNSAVGKQVVERYTRRISLQVQAHARGVQLTPELKRKAQGQPVVVELLLVIGQDGMLQRYSVSRSSGFAELDQAAIGAAYRAAPFPPPPAEYSGYGFKVAIFVG